MRVLVGVLAIAAGGVAVAQAAGSTTDVTAGGVSFSQPTVTIAVGDTVHWKGGGGTHNVVLDDGSYRSGDPTASLDASHTFTAPGTYTYYCEVHKAYGMTGTIVVQGDGSATPTPTPSPTAAPAAPALTKLTVKRAVRQGTVSGSVSASPAGARVTIAADVGGSATVTARTGSTPFALELPRKARRALKAGPVRVKLTATVRADGQQASRTTTVKLRVPAR